MGALASWETLSEPEPAEREPVESPSLEPGRRRAERVSRVLV